MKNTPETQWLAARLRERQGQPAREVEIDAAIQARYVRNCAVLVLDMSDFSRLTLVHGVIHFLAMIRRMADLAAPIVEQQGGQVVKQEADNLFAIFPDVPQAVSCARQVLARLAKDNVTNDRDSHLYASMGIGYGEILLIGEDDFFGTPVNLACKLGEDLAREGEVLLTEAAHVRLPQPSGCEPLHLSISGLDLVAYRLGKE